MILEIGLWLNHNISQFGDDCDVKNSERLSAFELWPQQLAAKKIRNIYQKQNSFLLHNLFYPTSNSLKYQYPGCLWRYVRASMSIAGVFPPICDYKDGHLLIDGCYVNNVPGNDVFLLLFVYILFLFRYL